MEEIYATAKKYGQLPLPKGEGWGEGETRQNCPLIRPLGTFSPREKDVSYLPITTREHAGSSQLPVQTHKQPEASHPQQTVSRSTASR